MCTTDRHDGACEDCARTDEWVDLTATFQEPQATTMPPMRGDGGEALEDR